MIFSRHVVILIWLTLLAIAYNGCRFEEQKQDSAYLVRNLTYEQLVSELKARMQQIEIQRLQINIDSLDMNIDSLKMILNTETIYSPGKEFYGIPTDTISKAYFIKREQAISQLMPIYGPDDRQDIYEVTNQDFLNNANCAAGLFYTEDLVNKGNGTTEIITQKFGDVEGLCPSENTLKLCKTEIFYDQPVAAECTGFAVSQNIIATAGHCINSDNYKDFKFIFGFQMLDSATPQLTINN